MMERALFVALGLACLATAAPAAAAPKGACGAPTIGCAKGECDEGPVAPFPAVRWDRVTLRYHDRCDGEDETRVYARRADMSLFEEVHHDRRDALGWRVATVSWLLPSTRYCFYVQTRKDGAVRTSEVRCVTTPARLGPDA